MLSKYILPNLDVDINDTPKVKKYREVKAPIKSDFLTKKRYREMFKNNFLNWVTDYFLILNGMKGELLKKVYKSRFMDHTVVDLYYTSTELSELKLDLV